jgi:hypothetical protein
MTRIRSEEDAPIAPALVASNGSAFQASRLVRYVNPIRRVPRVECSIISIETYAPPEEIRVRSVATPVRTIPYEGLAPPVVSPMLELEF